MIMSSLFLAFWGWMVAAADDLMTGLLENIPVVILISFLLGTYRRFRFSDLSYGLALAFLALHIYGARYTYPHHPLGEWMQEQFGFSRNHYDRIVHFAFGFLLAYPMREVCLRGLRLGATLSWWLPVVAVLALSAAYEILEWILVLFLSPERGESFLGMQGDQWDAQKDMALASVGSVLIVLLGLLAHRIRKRDKGPAYSAPASKPVSDYPPVW
jgi:putative membrane protein